MHSFSPSSSSASTSILNYLAVYLCLKISFFIIEIVLVYNFHQYFYQHQLCFMFCPISVFIIKGHSFKLFYRSIHFGPLLGVVPGFLSLNGTLSTLVEIFLAGNPSGFQFCFPSIFPVWFRRIHHLLWGCYQRIHS